MLLATTLSQVLAQTYIIEVLSFCLNSLILGGVGYMFVKLFDERRKR
jgi:hypothetical protein